MNEFMRGYRDAEAKKFPESKECDEYNRGWESHWRDRILEAWVMIDEKRKANK